MKNFFCFFILITLISCNERSENETISNTELIGSWNWVKSTGGISGTTETSISSNKVLKLVFTNSKMKIFENGNLSAEFNYEIQVKESIQGGSRPMLIYTPNKPNQTFIVQGAKLYLNDKCYDCFDSEYNRE